MCIWAGDGLGKETINLAVSNSSSFLTYSKYALNPVLDINSSNFRDPAVFFYTTDGQQRTSPPANHSPPHSSAGYWVATIAHSDQSHVEFWRSDDLLHWTFMSAFSSATVRGSWECPDLLRFEVEGSGGDVMWVLAVSVGGSAGNYWAGHFNGSAFTAVDATRSPPLQDAGLDYYAAISYKAAPGGRNILMAWMSGLPGYTAQLPTSPWRGSYTIPRTLTLHRLQLNASTSVYRMHQLPVAEVEAYRLQRYSLPQPVTVNASEPNRDLVRSQLHFGGADVLDLEVCAAYPRADASFGFYLRSNANHSERISVGLNYSMAVPHVLTVFVDRRAAGVTSFAASFPSLHEVELQVEELRAVDAAQVCVRVLLDRASVEVFVQRGYTVATLSVFPSPFIANELVEMWVSQGSVSVFSLDIYPFVDTATRTAQPAVVVTTQ